MIGRICSCAAADRQYFFPVLHGSFLMLLIV